MLNLIADDNFLYSVNKDPTINELTEDRIYEYALEKEINISYNFDL